jgi:hypothetical protein
MQRLLNEADERDMKVWSFCVWETVEQCTRDCVDDRVYGTCPILNLCKGRAHHGGGWFKIDDLIAKAKNMSPNTFAAQWECKKPSDSQLVYGNYFYEDVHVISLDPSSRFKTLYSVLGVHTIPYEWKRIGAIDFGARFCYVQFAVDPRYDIWIAEYEYYFEGDRLLDTHVQHIKTAPGWPRRMPIYADPAGKQERIELAKVHAIKTLPAIKNIDLGVDAVRKHLTISPILGKPKLYVLDTCARLRMEFETWAHPTNKDGTPNLDDYGDGPDEALDCFIKGTQISTPEGDVPIETIKVGDFVLTTEGYKPVVLTWQSPKPVCQIDLSDGRSLHGTLTHPVYVDGSGWNALDSTRYGDTLVASTPYKEKFQWQSLSPWSTEALSFAATQTLAKLATGIILRRALEIGSLELMLCTDKSGRTPMEKFLWAITSTIRTRIPSITDSQIWSVCLQACMYVSMLQLGLRHNCRHFGSMQSVSDHWQSPGMVLQKGERGMRSIHETSWMDGCFDLGSVTTVDRSSKFSIKGQPSFAPTSVRQRVADAVEQMTLRETVATAENASWPISTVRHGSVPVRVVGKRDGVETQVVYNLTVAECPEYFANGVLVHNCTRYAVFSYNNTHTSKIMAMSVAGV